MYDARNLKTKIVVSETQVECPVVNCPQKVVRQRSIFRREQQFQCPDHKIYISPSTFEYPSELDNLLWKDATDIALFEGVKKVKRESRIARDNSEDALTWNAFRYFEKTGYVSKFLSDIIGVSLPADTDLIYWSYSQRFNDVWPELANARQEFGERVERSSEPDLIAVNNQAVLFIEAKFTAPNETTPSDPQNQKKHLTGGNRWYQQVFLSDYDTVANIAKKYELLRFWLLGSWIAAQTNRAFYLVNLVRAEYEQEIERLFMPHIKPNTNRRFLRATWEEMYKYLAENAPCAESKDLLLAYFRHKTIGYNRFEELQSAFSIA